MCVGGSGWSNEISPQTLSYYRLQKNPSQHIELADSQDKDQSVHVLWPFLTCQFTQILNWRVWWRKWGDQVGCKIAWTVFWHWWALFSSQKPLPSDVLPTTAFDIFGRIQHCRGVHVKQLWYPPYFSPARFPNLTNSCPAGKLVWSFISTSEVGALKVQQSEQSRGKEYPTVGCNSLTIRWCGHCTGCSGQCTCCSGRRKHIFDSPD